MEHVFFESWNNVYRTIILVPSAYFTMVFLLRISGKRTLAKMNAFDLIITISLGSTLAAVALDKNVTFVDGAIAIFLLIFLQFILTWLSVRFKSFKSIITSKPTLLLYRGELLKDVIKKERIAIEELYAAARRNGILNLSEIDIIVLETTGDLTILQKVNNKKNEVLSDVDINY